MLTGETAMSLTTNEGSSGYSPAALATQLQRLFPAARAAFSKKNLMLYINFISGSGGASYFQPILDAARSAKYIVGGPDSMYLAPTTGRQYINGTLGITDYRGLIGIQVGDQSSGLNDPSCVVEDLINTALAWNMNFGFWQHLPGAPNFAPLMSYLQANPAAFVADYPSEFPT